MRPKRKTAILLSCLMVISLIVAQANDRRAKLGESRSVTLPSFAVLDENAQPVFGASGKVGFVSSVTAGSVISFSTSTGRVLSTLAVGETVGPVSMIEAGGRRLIAVAAANNPVGGNPATVSIIDATSAKRLELKSLLVLPSEAMITPATRALLTGDGRFCLIASSFNDPALYSFDTETGQAVSRVSLLGRPSEMSLYEESGRRTVAVASSVTNSLSIIKIDEQGNLSEVSNFSPAGARFDDSNNPAFGGGGRIVYIAAASGDALYMIDADSGLQLDLAKVEAPQRISVARGADGIEMVAATRIRRPGNAKPGGVTIFNNRNGRLEVRSEFTPPEGVEFSRTNNVAFSADGATAFVGSTTGVLFAFNSDTGELESYHAIGNELRRLSLSDSTRTIAAIRSSANGDEIVIINFDMVGPGEGDPNAPVIDRLSPETVEQGRLNNLQIKVTGKNFSQGASLVVGGVEVAADLARNGRALQAKLPKSIFDQPAVLQVQVKGAGGALSDARELRVVRPGAPVIDSISPAEVPGPTAPFALKVMGKNFRASSTIVVADQPLNTQYVGDGELRAQVPGDFTRAGASLRVQVKDLAVSDLVSANEKAIQVYGPRIRSLQADVGAVVAGDGGFILSISGDNFRSGAQIFIGNKPVASNRVRYDGPTRIKVNVPRELNQDAGRLAVVVRNPEGGQSDARYIGVRGPEIKSVGRGKLFAGTSDVRVNVQGANFRRGARVYVGNSNGAYRVAKQHVRFVSSRRVVVTLGGDFNRLLAQPGELFFKVVNPNTADGVPSVDQPLSVVGPAIADSKIKPSGDDGEYMAVSIDGANFRRGAIVEFIKEGAVVRQQSPVSVSEGRLLVMVPARKIEALGSFSLRVVNPGNVASALSQPRAEVSAAVNE